MKTIIFDKNSPAWCNDELMNEAFLTQQINFIDARFQHYGYMYLNFIYEVLGVVWDPAWDNICYQKGHDQLVIGCEHVGESTFRIDIR